MTDIIKTCSFAFLPLWPFSIFDTYAQGQKIATKSENRAFSFLLDTGINSCTCWRGGVTGPAQARLSQSHSRLPAERECCSLWVTPASCCKGRSGSQEASHDQRRKELGNAIHGWLLIVQLWLHFSLGQPCTVLAPICALCTSDYIFPCPVFETFICFKWW